eukprot:4217510-Amphidinium_carterae.1
MSIHTDSSAGKAVASRLGLNRKTKHVQLKYLYMQDIVQRGEMTITKVQTKTKSSRCFDEASSFGKNQQPDTVCEQSAWTTYIFYEDNFMIGLQQAIDTEAQPAVAGTTTTTATSRSRAMRHSQAQHSETEEKSNADTAAQCTAA